MENLSQFAFWCFQCNCNFTKEEFTSDAHLKLHIGKWLNGDIIKIEEVLKQRRGESFYMNTLENITKDPSRRDGNKKGCSCRHD